MKHAVLLLPVGALAAAVPALAQHLPDIFLSTSIVASSDGAPVLQNGGCALAEPQVRKLFVPVKAYSPEPATLSQPSQPEAEIVDVRLPLGFRYPNGIARASDGTLYVGSITSGHVLRRRPDQAWETLFAGSNEVFAGTSLRLDEASGLLWGASPDFLPGAKARPHRIFALNVQSGVVLRSLELPDGGFGNDIALNPNGNVYVTDSRNGRVLRLRPGAPTFEVVIEDERLRGAGGIGVGGIARDSNGRFVLGNYGSGLLFVLDDIDKANTQLRPIAFSRVMENPDGLAFGPDGSLLIIEGAAASGDGKLHRVPDPFVPGTRRIETLLTGLDSPVNLTVAADGHILVSEARVRHRLSAATIHDVPNSFRLLQLQPNNGPVR
jgi:sugar lactone lactonase YvrE